MTTKVCPACGAQYIPTATACADCKVALVIEYDDGTGDGGAVADADAHGGHDAHGGPDADAGDRDVDFDLDDDDLDDEEVGEALAYDLADWDARTRAALTDALDREDIPYGWDGDELLIDPIDEPRVEELIDAIDFPDAIEADDSPPSPADEVPDVMSDLFVAADRLRRNPDHSPSVLKLLESAEVAPSLPVPYGIDGSSWRAVLERTEALADALGENDDDAVQEAADALRELLRAYV